MSNTKKSYMTPEAASRIQSHSDRTGSNQDFKSRAMSSASINVNQGHASHGGSKSGSTGGGSGSKSGSGGHKGEIIFTIIVLCFIICKLL